MNTWDGLGEWYVKDFGAKKKTLRCGCRKYFMQQTAFGAGYLKWKQVLLTRCKKHDEQEFDAFDKAYTRNQKLIAAQQAQAKKKEPRP